MGKSGSDFPQTLTDESQRAFRKIFTLRVKAKSFYFSVVKPCLIRLLCAQLFHPYASRFMNASRRYISDTEIDFISNSK